MIWHLAQLILGLTFFYAIAAFWMFVGSLDWVRWFRRPKQPRYWPAPASEQPAPARSIAKLEQPVVASPFPLLNIRMPFTRDEVLEAYRRAAKLFHPDLGGWQESFLALVAERDKALSLAS